jgi:Holliday junction resolvase
MAREMNNRKRGDYFERQTRADLERRGWIVVRSAGSLGAADLVALHYNRPAILVACKIPGYMRPTENDALIEAALRAGAIPMLAFRKDARNGDGTVAYSQITKPKTPWGRHFMAGWAANHGGDDAER